MQNQEVSRPQYYRLLEHPFGIATLKNEKIASEPLGKQAIEAWELGQKPKYSFTPEMAYHHNVNYYFGTLTDTLERIEQVPIFLRRFPNSKFYADNDITLHKWVNYHYTNFIIMSVSLYDIALLLTNEVFLLGNEARFCNKKSVAKHKLVRKTSVKNSLDNLEQAIDEYRNHRHRFVHRGHAPSMGFMDKLDRYDFIQKSEKKFGLENTSKHSGNLLSNPVVLKLLYKGERKQLIAQIKQKNSDFIDLFYELFNSLEPIYENVSEQYRKPPNPALS